MPVPFPCLLTSGKSPQRLAQISWDLDGSPLLEIEQDGDHLGDGRAAVVVKDRASQRQRRAAKPQDAGSDPHTRAIQNLEPEIDLDANDGDRERASADRLAGLREKGDARGLEEAADRRVVAMAKRVKVREPDPVLEPVTIERGLKAVRG